MRTLCRSCGDLENQWQERKPSSAPVRSPLPTCSAPAQKSLPRRSWHRRLFPSLPLPTLSHACPVHRSSFHSSKGLLVWTLTDSNSQDSIPENFLEKHFLESSTISWLSKIYNGESIWTLFQEAGHLDSHPPVYTVLYFSVSMVLNHGLLTATAEAPLRSVRNQDTPSGHAKAFCGSSKGCGFVPTLCAVPNHTQAPTEIQRPKPITQVKKNSNSDFMKELSQTI